MQQVIKVKKWDIVFADLDGSIGSEQNLSRYCLVIQNDKGNLYSPTTIVIPMTTKHKKKNLPTNVKVDNRHNSYLENSVLLAEQPRTIDKVRILKNYGQLKNINDKHKEINNAIKISLGL